MIYCLNFIPHSMLQLLYCVWVAPVHSLSSRNKPGTWCPLTIQATGYLTHNNALRYSWPHYILHWSIFSEQVLKWQNIISSSVCRLCPLPPFIQQKWVLKCVSWLYATLYINSTFSVPLIFSCEMIIGPLM